MLKWFAIPFSKDHILSERSTMTHLSWVALHGMAHSFIELDKAVVHVGTSLVAQVVKHLPTMWENRVRSLGWEDLLEKEMATHSSTLAWKIPWAEEPDRLQSMGSQRVGHD